MGRTKPRRRNAECAVWQASMPSFSFDELQKGLTLPQPIRLPPFDVRAAIDEFCCEYGLRVKHCTQLLGPLHNKSLWAAVEAHDLLATRAREHPDELHVLVTTEFNIEAMMLHMNAVFQMDRPAFWEDSSSILFYCHERLHAMLYQGHYTLPCYDIDDVRVLRNMLKTLLPDEECVICMADMSEEESTHPFVCGHGMCVSCGREHIQSCPTCNSPLKPTIKVRFVPSS